MLTFPEQIFAFYVFAGILFMKLFSVFRTVLLKLSTLCVYIWLIYSDIEKAAAFSGTGGLSVNATLVSTKVCTWFLLLLRVCST